MTDHNRLDIRRDLADRLTRGQSINMLAPRRVGKTWTMKKVAADLESQGWTVIMINVEGMRAPEQMIRALCREMEKTQDIKKRLLIQAKHRFDMMLGGKSDGSLEDALLTVNHSDLLEALIEGLAHQEAPNAVIMIDEIAQLTLTLVDSTDPTQAHALLYQIRNLQQRFGKVRWFLTGSVGLDSVARQHGLGGALVNFSPYTIEPFTREEARSFAVTPEAQPGTCTGFDYEDDAFEELVSQLGWLSPFYIWGINDLIRDLPPPPRPGAKPLATRANIEAAINRLLRPDQRNRFDTWNEHIDKNFQQATSSKLRAILARLAAESDGETVETLLSALPPAGVAISARELKDALILLELNGFLQQVGERWRFRSGLLRRWWLEYVV